MIDKKTVFILGAGASCPYGYPSGAHLRELICLSTDHSVLVQTVGEDIRPQVNRFKKTFESSSTKSIDLFMARNPELAPVGKYIIAFETFRAEQISQFREKANWAQEQRKHPQPHLSLDGYLMRKAFQGDDWYSYLFDRVTENLAAPITLPDFSDGKVAFITFNYDRSLEYFLYESLSNSFTKVPEAEVIKCLKKLKILHVYGQVAPLKWQDSNEGVDYRLEISESLLRSASSNIRTIYEEKENPELKEAQGLLAQAERIFFLGFGYAPENMEVLGLPGIIPPINCEAYGTAFGLNDKEVERIRSRIIEGLKFDSMGFKNRGGIVIKAMDCLELLRNYLE